MSDKTLKERLQPSLLDRLTDAAPEEVSERREARVIDMRRLRDIIRRDLAWLLNTTDMGAELDAALYPHAARSVLNYGLPDLAGDYSTADRVAQIRASIRTAIERFEPRIRKESIEVRDHTTEGRTGTTITFDIVADMWAEPMPLELYLRSEIDVTTGHVDLEHRV